MRHAGRGSVRFVSRQHVCRAGAAVVELSLTILLDEGRS